MGEIPFRRKPTSLTSRGRAFVRAYVSCRLTASAHTLSPHFGLRARNRFFPHALRLSVSLFLSRSVLRVCLSAGQPPPGIPARHFRYTSLIPLPPSSRLPAENRAQLYTLYTLLPRTVPFDQLRPYVYVYICTCQGNSNNSKFSLSLDPACRRGSPHVRNNNILVRSHFLRCGSYCV